MAAVFGVSKATLVFSGPLAPYLSQGIGLVLLGAVLMALVAVGSIGCRTVVVQPQDVTAVLLATAAGTLVADAGLAGDAAYATVVVMVALATVLTGLTAYAIGRLRLAHLVRYVPRQVTAGFLAASGLLLVREAFGIVLPGIGAATVSDLVAAWTRWLPWLALALGLSIAVRRWRNGVLVPLVLLAAVLAFHLALPLLGIGVDAARAGGWLLGPFQRETFVAAPSLARLHDVQWPALPQVLPVLFAVAGLSLLGALLNVTSLELLGGREADLDRDLRTIGVANTAAGLVGGLPGYHMVGMTRLSRRIGLTGAAAGVSVAVVGVLCLAFGADLLAALPRGLVACVIWYMGFDLLLSALWDHGRRLPLRDRALVAAVPIVAVTLGVLPAIALGVLAACLLFVFVYAQIDVVRLSTTAAHLRARVERSPQARERLRVAGERVHIHRLTGFLFFGSAHRALEPLRRSLLADVPPRAIVVDLKGVVGLDLSAWDALDRLARRCAERAVRLVLTGLSGPLERQRRLQAGSHASTLAIGGDLNDTLASLEEEALAAAATTSAATDAPPAADDELADLLRRHAQPRAVRAGETLMREGDPSDSLMLLLDGQLVVTVAQADGRRTTINRLLPGALFGEVGYCAQTPRSASIAALHDGRVLVLDARQLQRIEQQAPVDAARLHRALARVVAERLIAATRLLRDADL